MWLKNLIAGIRAKLNGCDRRKKLLLGAEVCAICAALLTGVLLSASFMRERRSRRLAETLQETVITTPAPTAEPASEPQPSEEDTEEQRLSPVKVDFEELMAQNEDTYAWIYLEDTAISYPVVWRQGDNETYLETLFDGTWNPAGTIFIDGRAEKPLEDRNTVIYGHNMLDGTMFGIIDKYRDQEYWEKHPTMYLITPDTVYRLDVCYTGLFGVESALFEFPVTEESFKSVLERMEKGSYLDTGIVPTENDRLVTLSTCWGRDDERIAVIGILSQVEEQTE